MKLARLIYDHMSYLKQKAWIRYYNSATSENIVYKIQLNILIDTLCIHNTNENEVCSMFKEA